MSTQQADAPNVIVVGSGNAAFAAAVSATEAGARVLMLEKAPEAWIGGNTWFTAGAYRLPHRGLEDVRRLLIDVPDEPVDLPPYDEEAFEADMLRVTQGKTDRGLMAILVSEARPAAEWMKGHGMGWRLMVERQAHRSGGRLRFWGGLAVGAAGGGAGMVEAWTSAARRLGITLQTDSPVEAILVEDGAVAGVRVATQGDAKVIRAPSVVLASGGFEASPELRARHLGPQWRSAAVRGTPYNTGEMLSAALEIGAQAVGDWAGCHAIAWDAGAPAHGSRGISNRYSRQAYPWGLAVNVRGDRFIDEGSDFRNYTYAKYGVEILRQPGGVAYQLFDAKTMPYVSGIDYDTARDSRYEADSIRELAERAGIDPDGLERTIREFNAAVQPGPLDPAVLDGKGTAGIVPPKSNWAQRFDQPPFVAFAVRCGITFTFGGIGANPDGAVLDEAAHPIGGLFVAGEAMGGLFHHNYPGGTGLASGAVFGRRAGRHAAEHATKRGPT